MVYMKEIKCPHCNNTDKSMVELIKIFPKFLEVYEAMYEYLCNSCSKTWLSETKIEGVN